MHKYERLEKLYLISKVKKYFLIFLIIFLLMVATYLLFFIEHSPKNSFSEPKESNTSAKEINSSFISKEEASQTFILIESNITHTSRKELINENNLTSSETNRSKKEITPLKEKLYLKPMISPELIFEQRIKDAEMLSKDKKTEKTSKPLKEKELNTTNPKEKEIKLEVKKEKNVPDIDLQVRTKKETFDLLKSRYNYKNNFQDAIKIAQLLYNKKLYRESVKWALKANELDAEDYRSWALYAKSLIKLHEIEKASEVLETYIKEYGNREEINTILRSIHE